MLALVHDDRLPLRRLIAALTIKPAQAYQLSERVGRPIGTLSAGAAGDAVIFDPTREWTVDADAFASQGQNTPLAGSTLRGRIQMTIYDGKIVYE